MMTRKEQNKILDDKIESNINQYKVDRMNAEISAFSSGDLNKYEFLTRKDLKYKPNALDKARFEFSPLGQTFNIGLDKTAQCYQEEGAIKLLKDIRDSLAGGIAPRGPGGPGGPRGPREPRGPGLDEPNNDAYDYDDYNYDDYITDYNDDRPDGRPNEQYFKKESIFVNNLLNEIDDANKKNKNIIDDINEKNNDYLKKIHEQNGYIEKLKKEVIDNKKLTKDILNESGEKINKFYQEKLKHYNELEYEIERNNKIIKKRDDLLYDIVRNARDNINENEINKNILERELKRLNDLNKEYLDIIDKHHEKKEKYKNKINELKMI